MDFVSVLLPIALILLVCKSLAILCRRFGLPQVVGYLVGGILLGLVRMIPTIGTYIFRDDGLDGLGFLAKVGVVLIMFSAGLETDLGKVKSTGIKSILITLAGVIVPMGLGFLVTMFFLEGGYSNIGENYKEALAYGCILTATSVSVTVATLKELGKLDTEMGTCIVSAAILDDIIGVVVLSLVLGLDGVNSGTTATLVKVFNSWNMNQAVSSVLGIILFFVIFVPFGIILSRFFQKLSKRYDHHRRIPVFALAICFTYAWIAEEIFGVADITGAFLAGILLSSNIDKGYIDRRTDIFTGFLFGPVFFANIGITMSFDNIDGEFILLGILFVIVGIAGKLLGCGLVAKCCGFNLKDSASIGVGMMVRAEVALVCCEKLKSVVNPNITTFVVLLILITSLIAPILLKLLNKPTNEDVGVTPPLN